MTSEDDWRRVIDETVQQHGRLDVLVNNAGIAVIAPLEQETLDGWRRTQAINVEGVFIGSREAVRVMKTYGNSGVKVLVNTRAIHPVGVIAGDLESPSLETIEKGLKELTPHVWVLDATEEAMKLGNPILSNIVMIGAVSGLNLLPIGMAEFKSVIRFLPPKTSGGQPARLRNRKGEGYVRVGGYPPHES